MHIVADRMMPGLDETFGRHGNITRVEGRTLKSSALVNTDVLLVRSITRVNKALLENSPVKFVGTASIGTDHLDTEWLNSRGITWASAPGCNADAAAQYTLGMILLACERRETDLRTRTVGIIGHGNVGSRLAALLQTLDLEVIACDPPLQEQGHPGLVSLDQALGQSIISLHVPLTTDGPCPTRHMIGKKAAGSIPADGILVNASRGAVIDTAAIETRLNSQTLGLALDVWPDEPNVSSHLIASSTVATPHVAGHSLIGKLNGTHMIYRSCCQSMGWSGDTAVRQKEVKAEFSVLPGANSFSAICKVIADLTGVARDDARMRKLGQLDQPELASGFDQLRREYSPRYEFSETQINGLSSSGGALASRLGFKVG